MRFVTMTPEQAIAFVEKHGIVLESASGPVPSLAQTIVGNTIKGSWWSHPMGKEIFQITRAVRGSQDILVCRLVGGKITFIHERIWPALVRTAARFRPDQISQLVEEHLASGKHVTRETPFPAWVPARVAAQADNLEEEQALSVLDSIIPGVLKTI
jgi:hypothetical protein